MIGIPRRPKGGFGNRLWTYLNLRILADNLRSSYFSLNREDRNLIRGINREPVIPLRFRKVLEVRPPLIDPNELRWVLDEALDSHYLVSIRGPMLGEVFAAHEFDGVSRRSLVRARVCESVRKHSDDNELATVHLRAGDFVDWHPEAILGVDYYLPAIEAALEVSNNIVFRVCRDDPQHPALESVTDYLRQKGILAPEHHCQNPIACDFVAMADSKVLISSPSTFSILAGILGSALVVQSRDWAESRAQRGENFWQRVLDNSLPSYPIQALI